MAYHQTAGICNWCCVTAHGHIICLCGLHSQSWGHEIWMGWRGLEVLEGDMRFNRGRGEGLLIKLRDIHAMRISPVGGKLVSGYY